MFLSGSHVAVNYVTLPNSNIVSCQKTAAPCISCHVQRALPDRVESLDKWAAFPQGFPQVVMKVGLAFTHVVIRASSQGQGELRSGDLFAPVQFWVKSEFASYLVF